MEMHDEPTRAAGSFAMRVRHETDFESAPEARPGSSPVSVIEVCRWAAVALVLPVVVSLTPFFVAHQFAQVFSMSTAKGLAEYVIRDGVLLICLYPACVAEAGIYLARTSPKDEGQSRASAYELYAVITLALLVAGAIWLMALESPGGGYVIPDVVSAIGCALSALVLVIVSIAYLVNRA